LYTLRYVPLSALYTPGIHREAYMGGIPHYTHPGRHIWEVYLLLYLPGEAYMGDYLLLYPPGSIYGRLYPVIPTRGGIYEGYTPLYPPGEAYKGGLYPFYHPGRHIRRFTPSYALWEAV